MASKRGTDWVAPGAGVGLDVLFRAYGLPVEDGDPRRRTNVVLTGAPIVQADRDALRYVRVGLLPGELALPATVGQRLRSFVPPDPPGFLRRVLPFLDKYPRLRRQLSIQPDFFEQVIEAKGAGNEPKTRLRWYDLPFVIWLLLCFAWQIPELELSAAKRWELAGLGGAIWFLLRVPFRRARR